MQPVPEFTLGLLSGLLGTIWAHTRGYCWHLRAGTGQGLGTGGPWSAEQEAQSGQPLPPCRCSAWLVDCFKCLYLRFWRILFIFKIKRNCLLGHMDTPGWLDLPWTRGFWSLPRFRLSAQSGMACRRMCSHSHFVIHQKCCWTPRHPPRGQC